LGNLSFEADVASCNVEVHAKLNADDEAPSEVGDCGMGRVHLSKGTLRGPEASRALLLWAFLLCLGNSVRFPPLDPFVADGVGVLIVLAQPRAAITEEGMPRRCHLRRRIKAMPIPAIGCAWSCCEALCVVVVRGVDAFAL